MNTARILICLIFTIIVALLVAFYVNNDNENNGKEDYTTAELRDMLLRARIANESRATKLDPLAADAFSASSSFETTPEQPSDPILKQLTDEEELAMKQEEEAIAQAEIDRQANLLETEQLGIEDAQISAELAENQPPAVSSARLQLISQALVMATVNHFDEQSGITLLDVVRPQNIVSGQVLGIRRQNTGIIGRVKVDRIQPDGKAFADPILSSFFGKPVDVRVGDELIVIP